MPECLEADEIGVDVVGGRVVHTKGCGLKAWLPANYAMQDEKIAVFSSSR